MSIITCCKDCENRFLGCHSTCKDYLYQSEQNSLLNAKIKRERDNYNMADNFRGDMVRKVVKRRRKK